MGKGKTLQRELCNDWIDLPFTRSILDLIICWTVGGHCLVLGDYIAPHVEWRSGCFAPFTGRFSCKLLEASCERGLHHHVCRGRQNNVYSRSSIVTESP